MSKKRSLDTNIRLDEDFADLSYRQRDLWHGLITVADDQGRLPGHPGAIRSLIWPMDTVSIDDVRNDLAMLASDKHGYIYQYDIEGKSYIQIINWWKHQTMQWAGPSGYPSPEGWLDRYRYHGKKHKVITLNWETPGGFCMNVEVKDNVNVNVNVNPDKSGLNKGSFKALKDTSTTPYNKLLDTFINVSKLPLYGNLTQRDNESLVRMVDAECLPSDIEAAVRYNRENGLRIVGVASIEKGAMIERANRLNDIEPKDKFAEAGYK